MTTIPDLRPFQLPTDLAESVRGRRVFITGSGKHNGLGQAFAYAAGLSGAASGAWTGKRSSRWSSPAC